MQFNQARNLMQIFEESIKEVADKKDDNSYRGVSELPQRESDAKKSVSAGSDVLKLTSVRTSELDAVKTTGVQKRSNFTEDPFDIKISQNDKYQDNVNQPKREIPISRCINIKVCNLETHEKPLNQYIAENKNTETERFTKISESPNEKNKLSIPSSVLKKKLEMHKKKSMNQRGSSISNVSSSVDVSFEDSSSTSDGIRKKHAKNWVFDSDDESITEILEKINADYPKPVRNPEKDKYVTQALKNHVNPFKNVDPNISVFVDKLVSPILMVHSKMNKRFQPSFNIRDINFNSHIQIILKNMNVERPMTMQSMSWFAILRGYSTFLISPKDSGKTMGYIPAICNLIADNVCLIPGTGPICIIVCATAMSVSSVERLAKHFLNRHTVLACYTGMNDLDLTTSLLNGCDLLIATPSLLVRLLQSTEFGVDISRLTTFVIDDCERVAEVYSMEMKFTFVKIKEMLKSRTVKELKVQYILASRVWSDLMEPLAKKASDTVVCIGAFQECVLYSKANTNVSFLSRDKKIDSVLEFVEKTDRTKRIVIVCRSDDEVEELKNALTSTKHTVLACNTTMTVQDLHSLSISWNENKATLSGPIMICCDDNLSHMNITDAHYLVQYSLPDLYSKFCKRFSVLNDNYRSIFKQHNEDVKIKILLDAENTEQLPKILHFIERCISDVPEALKNICSSVLSKKELAKADSLVPVCDNLLTLGECPDFWNCQERHVLKKGLDEPKDWVPTKGAITFKIIHYHNAVLYSARLLTHVDGAVIRNYPENYSILSMKISMYFSKESNRKLHGSPKVGDICAVSVKQNFFVRCQVVKILNHHQNGRPNYVLVRKIDEETLKRTRDIYLYHLPNDMQTPETYVVHVRLANIQPKDKDITFADLAMEQLQMITETDTDLYLRGNITLTVGNCIFVDRLETCKDLSVTDTTIIRHDFRKELAAHAIDNPQHVVKLKKICKDSNLEIIYKEEVLEVPKPVKKVITPQWAHLEKDDLSLVFFESALDPGTFFVRLVKFKDSRDLLIKDIKKYTELNLDPVTDVEVGDIVLAKFPGASYVRARIHEVMKNSVDCFFVDHGEYMEVPIQDLTPIPEMFVTRLPFQAIECRLFGVKSVGRDWTDFSTTWLSNQFVDESGHLKQLYVQYYAKEKAFQTEGNKYAVVVFDTTSDGELNINKMLVEANLADPKDEEWRQMEELRNGNNTQHKLSKSKDDDESDDDGSWENVNVNSNMIREVVSQPKVPFDELFQKMPKRSVPLVCSSDEDDKWEIHDINDLMFRPQEQKFNETPKSNLLAIKNSLPNNETAEATESQIETLIDDNDSDSSCSILEKVRKFQIINVNNERKNTNNLQIVSSVAKTLDSDDISTPELSVVSSAEIQGLSVNIQRTNIGLEVRKPTLRWRQNKQVVSFKILLIGVEKYDIKIEKRCVKFIANSNGTQYEFHLNLYGVINAEESSHENKGQYILVKLNKVINKNWFSLTRDGHQKWIVYDADSIDTSSDEEKDVQVITENDLNHVVKIFDKVESDSEDEDFVDDAMF